MSLFLLQLYINGGLLGCVTLRGPGHALPGNFEIDVF